MSALGRPARSLGLLGALLALAGCAGAPLRYDAATQARSAIAGLAAAYQRAEADVFFEGFDLNAFPAFDVFRERVRDFLLRNRQITIDLIVDAVVEDAHQAAAQVHWNRSFLNETGAYKLDSGRCELIFDKRPSGGLALAAIHGDSPF